MFFDSGFLLSFYIFFLSEVHLWLKLCKSSRDVGVFIKLSSVFLLLSIPKSYRQMAITNDIWFLVWAQSAMTKSTQTVFPNSSAAGLRTTDYGALKDSWQKTKTRLICLFFKHRTLRNKKDDG